MKSSMVSVARVADFLSQPNRYPYTTSWQALGFVNKIQKNPREKNIGRLSLSEGILENFRDRCPELQNQG